jgi:Flp pilus assembly pilin Flp
MKTLFARFVKDESGVVQGLGTNLKNTFSSVSTALK